MNKQIVIYWHMKVVLFKSFTFPAGIQQQEVYDSF